MLTDNPGKKSKEIKAFSIKYLEKHKTFHFLLPMLCKVRPLPITNVLTPGNTTRFMQISVLLRWHTSHDSTSHRYEYSKSTRQREIDWICTLGNAIRLKMNTAMMSRTLYINIHIQKLARRWGSDRLRYLITLKVTITSTVSRIFTFTEHWQHTKENCVVYTHVRMERTSHYTKHL